jgi:RNA polymerase sigma-70 factor (ECF subfamily)
MARWTWFRRGTADATAAKGVAGRRDEFERLASEHSRALYGAALRLTRNPDDAQDLTQDALIRAYASFDRFTPGSNFRAWSLRIMTNLYISQRRKKTVVRVDATGESDCLEQNPVSRDNRYSEPDTALFENALDEEIELALGRLSAGLRAAVLLVDVDEMTYEEASQALGIPVGTIRSRLNRGRELLREYLADYARERRAAPARRSAP